MDKQTELAIGDLKTILDFMLEHGADGSCDKAYEASVRLKEWLDSGGAGYWWGMVVREATDD